MPVFPNENAAEALFADKLYAILRDFDKDWADNNLEWWRERFDYLQKSQEELQKLEEKRRTKRRRKLESGYIDRRTRTRGRPITALSELSY
ncbi:MAG: hypothetical protein H6937_12705 [Burkholderiales bacterium]|nr:hypothetical protein [Burkholderiales bacterium]